MTDAEWLAQQAVANPNYTSLQRPAWDAGQGGAYLVEKPGPPESSAAPPGYQKWSGSSGNSLQWTPGAFAAPGGNQPDNPLGAFNLPETYTPAPGASTAPAPTVGPPVTTPMIAPYVPHGLPDDISPDEDLLVRTIYGEAGGETPTGQRAVAAVIRNRAADSGLGIPQVVFGVNQFEPWNNAATRKRLEALDHKSPEYQKILATIRADTSDPTGGATHFYSPKTQLALGRAPPAWGNGDPTAIIGGHNFYRVGFKPGSGAPGAPPAIQFAGAPAAAPVQTAAVVPPRVAPLNGLSSLRPGANAAAQSLQQRMAYLQQLQSLFKTAKPQQAAAHGAASMIGGVNESIPLMAGRGYA